MLRLLLLLLLLDVFLSRFLSLTVHSTAYGGSSQLTDIIAQVSNLCVACAISSVCAVDTAAQSSRLRKHTFHIAGQPACCV